MPSPEKYAAAENYFWGKGVDPDDQKALKKAYKVLSSRFQLDRQSEALAELEGHYDTLQYPPPPPVPLPPSPEVYTEKPTRASTWDIPHSAKAEEPPPSEPYKDEWEQPIDDQPGTSNREYPGWRYVPAEPEPRGVNMGSRGTRPMPPEFQPMPPRRVMTEPTTRPQYRYSDRHTNAADTVEHRSSRPLETFETRSSRQHEHSKREGDRGTKKRHRERVPEKTTHGSRQLYRVKDGRSEPFAEVAESSRDKTAHGSRQFYRVKDGRSEPFAEVAESSRRNAREERSRGKEWERWER